MKEMSKKNVVKHYGIVFCLVIAGVILDQWTKHLAVQHLKSGTKYVLIDSVLQLNYTENSGAAWGMLQGKQMLFLILTIAILFLIVVVYRKIPFTKRYLPMRIVLVMLTCGAIGNLIDRICTGYVVDFIEFIFIDFPIFNVADIFVTVSMVMLILFGLLFYKNEDFEFMEKKRAVSADDDVSASEKADDDVSANEKANDDVIENEA